MIGYGVTGESDGIADNYYTYNPNEYILDPVKLDIWVDCNDFFIPEIVYDNRQAHFSDHHIRLGPTLDTVWMCDLMALAMNVKETYGIRPLVELDSAVTNTQVRKITN